MDKLISAEAARRAVGQQMDEADNLQAKLSLLCNQSVVRCARSWQEANSALRGTKDASCWPRFYGHQVGTLQRNLGWVDCTPCTGCDNEAAAQSSDTCSHLICCVQACRCAENQFSRDPAFMCCNVVHTITVRIN